MIKSRININTDFKCWAVYFITIIFSNFFHELGHCIPAWTHGFSAIPTPAKEYLLESIPSTLNNYVSLGGVVNSIAFPIIVFAIFISSSYKFNTALLAGAIAMPGIYSLRFALQGRGHDETEFQEAQTAMNFNYSGHFLDWLFLFLFIIGIFLWIFKCKPDYKIAGRLLIGIVLTIIFIILLQKINNAVFDPIFRR